MNHLKKAKALAFMLGILLLPTAVLPASAADPVLTGYRGDINQDGTLSVADAVLLMQHLSNKQPFATAEAGERADVQENDIIDVFDLSLLKQCLLGQHEWIGIYTESTDPIEDNTDFFSPSIAATGASLASHGNSNLVIFSIEFPDCTYGNKYDADRISQLAFGAQNTSSSNYPFESMTAFFQRGSKGSMNLQGKVFNYTAKESISVYNDNKVKIVEECYDAFAASEDFSKYDANGDGKIDATLITVPESASTDYWWPCSGAFGDPGYRVDGVAVGNIITGNVAPADERNFNSTYLHEMGHCMGLPDYYLYYSSDSEGMHGTAGTELMDTDAFSDFSGFSKLMLGWYRSSQVSVYDAGKGAQTFTLNNAQTDAGNCVIIPYGSLDDRFFSEYFVIEYATEDGNNSGVGSLWWQDIESGIRIFHVNAELFSDNWGAYLKYQNGSYYTNNDDDGIRLIRLVNDGGGVFKTGAVINNSTSGFGWYDGNGQETVNPGVSISIGELANGSYSVTVSPQ